MARAVRGALTAGAGRAAGLHRAGVVAPVAWLTARFAVGLGFLAAHGAVDALRPGDPPLPLVQGLLAWDGAFYRDIATIGYEGLPDEALRFFPLLPVLGRVFGEVLPGGAATGLVVVANVAALVAAVLLHRLVLHEGGSSDRASASVWLLALVPAAAVLVLAYTEALFLALSIGAFLALRRGHWLVVAALGILAGLCRPSGVVLVLPIAIEAVRGLREAGFGERLARLAACASPAAGTGLYLGWVGARYGDPLLPLEVQGEGDLRGAWVDPVSRIARAVAAAPEEGFLGEALHLPWIALFLGLTVVVGRRLPAAYTAYTVGILLLALSATSLGSFERYGLTAFPLAIAAASLLRPGAVERAVLAGLAAATAAYTSMVLLGVFVP